MAVKLSFSDTVLPEGTTEENYNNIKVGVFQYLPNGVNTGNETIDTIGLVRQFKPELISYIGHYTNQYISSKKGVVLIDEINNTKLKAEQVRNGQFDIEEYSYNRQENELSCSVLINLEPLILWGDLNAETLLLSKGESENIFKITYSNNVVIRRLDEIKEENGN